MKTARWLEPRYTERNIYEKDFPIIDLNGLEVYCPGCNTLVRLARKSPLGKVAGWCKQCNRAITS